MFILATYPKGKWTTNPNGHRVPRLRFRVNSDVLSPLLHLGTRLQNQDRGSAGIQGPELSSCVAPDSTWQLLSKAPKHGASLAASYESDNDILQIYEHTNFRYKLNIQWSIQTFEKFKRHARGTQSLRGSLSLSLSLSDWHHWRYRSIGVSRYL